MVTKIVYINLYYSGYFEYWITAHAGSNEPADKLAKVAALPEKQISVYHEIQVSYVKRYVSTE